MRTNSASLLLSLFALHGRITAACVGGTASGGEGVELTSPPHGERITVRKTIFFTFSYRLNCVQQYAWLVPRPYNVSPACGASIRTPLPCPTLLDSRDNRSGRHKQPTVWQRSFLRYSSWDDSPAVLICRRRRSHPPSPRPPGALGYQQMLCCSSSSRKWSQLPWGHVQ